MATRGSDKSTDKRYSEYYELFGEDAQAVIDEITFWENEDPTLIDSDSNVDTFDEPHSPDVNVKRPWEKASDGFDLARPDAQIQSQPESTTEPPPKKAKVSNQFAMPKSSPEREKAARGVIPQNTESSTRWALKNFNSWKQHRAAISSPVPSDLLRSHDPEIFMFIHDGNQTGRWKLISTLYPL